MQELKLLITNKEQKTDYKEIYVRLFYKSLKKYHSTDDKNNLKQISYYGVKAVNEILKDEIYEYKELSEMFELIEVVKTAMSLLTPTELITVFPVDKKFDGDKYGIKDYFFTIAELQKNGMNNIIMEHIDELLWDYMNIDINLFLVNSMSILNRLKEIETGESFLEKWAKENGVRVYKKCKYEGLKGEYLYDEKNGKHTLINKEVPKLKLLKGGI